MSLSADENIKPGKTFNVILNISDSGNLGAVHAWFIYDSTKLKLKSCVIEGKTSEEYLKYNDAEGEINLIYMIKNRPSKEAIIKFRFEPYKSEETTYKFSKTRKQFIIITTQILNRKNQYVLQFLILQSVFHKTDLQLLRKVQTIQNHKIKRRKVKMIPKTTAKIKSKLPLDQVVAKILLIPIRMMNIPKRKKILPRNKTVMIP